MKRFYQGSGAVKQALFALRFSDSRTIRRLKLFNLFKSYYFVLPSSFDGQQLVLSDAEWEEIRTELTKKKLLQKNDLTYILNYFRNVKWSLKQDPSTEALFRSLVESSAPKQYVQIPAGTRIIDQGETVKASHIAMLQAMKKTLTEKRRLFEPLTLLSSFLFAALLLLLGALYLQMRHKKIFHSIHYLSLYATVIILTLLFAKIFEYFLLRHGMGLIEMVRFPLFIPFLAILLTVLLNVEIALFSSFLLGVVFRA